MAHASFASPLTLSNLTTKIPKLIYGTAWKKERTVDLVYQAIKSGFRGIDTAAQPKHYQENLVGDGIRRAIKEGIVRRDELFIQTKFTPPSGQDHANMPYSLDQSLEERIHTSVASSLKNLTTGSDESETYIDCLVIHSPLPTIGETEQAWQVLSTYVPHKIHALGISNTNFDVLKALINNDSLKVKPSVVQNRFYPGTSYDSPIRHLCRKNNIIFQSFWTLTGNPHLLKSATVQSLAREFTKLGLSENGDGQALALYSLVLGLGSISVLNGTTRTSRMVGDLEGVKKVGEWIEGEGREKWDAALEEFKDLIGEAEVFDES